MTADGPEGEGPGTLAAYGAGLILVLAAGIWIEFHPQMAKGAKTLLYGSAFILFIASEPIWAFLSRFFPGRRT